MRGRRRRRCLYSGKPCIQEVPFYNELQRSYDEKDFLVLGVAIESGSKTAVQEFARRYKVQYPLALGSGRHTMEFGGVRNLPTTFLLDQKGRVRKRYIGTSRSKQIGLREDIQQLLKGRA